MRFSQSLVEEKREYKASWVDQTYRNTDSVKKTSNCVWVKINVGNF